MKITDHAGELIEQALAGTGMQAHEVYWDVSIFVAPSEQGPASLLAITMALPSLVVGDAPVQGTAVLQGLLLDERKVSEVVHKMLQGLREARSKQGENTHQAPSLSGLILPR